MGWTNDAPLEITAPGNVPFLPGYDTIGIGSQLPQELLDYGISAAMVFYNSSWNPAATTGKIKYAFIASYQAAIVSGFCYVANPSVNQVGQIRTADILGIQPATKTVLNTVISGITQQTVVSMFEDITGNGRFEVYAADGSYAMSIDANAKTLRLGTALADNVILNGAAGLISLGDPASSVISMLLDGANHTITLLNRTAAPATVTNGGVIYVQAGSLRYKGSSGTVTTIAPA